MGHIYILTDPRYCDGHPKHVRYVGITVRNIKERFVEHIRASENTHRDNWIRQLKREGLLPNCEVFESIDGISKKELGIEERYWIAQFKAWGFKLTNGTSGGDGVYDLPPEVEARRAAKLSATKRKQFAENPELTERFRQSLKSWREDKNIVAKWNSGIEASWQREDVRKRHIESLNHPDVKAKISQSSKQMWQDEAFRRRKIQSQFGEKNCNARAVVHLQSGTVFGSSNCAERWLRDNGYPNASGSAILRACKGKLNCVYGSQWRYRDKEFVPYTFRDRTKSNNPTARAVVCLETNMLFLSMAEAIEWLASQGKTGKATTSLLWRVCNKYSAAKTAHGYRWRYATDEEKLAGKVLDTQQQRRTLRLPINKT